MTINSVTAASNRSNPNPAAKGSSHVWCGPSAIDVERSGAGLALHLGKYADRHELTRRDQQGRPIIGRQLALPLEHLNRTDVVPPRRHQHRCPRHKRLRHDPLLLRHRPRRPSLPSIAHDTPL